MDIDKIINEVLNKSKEFLLLIASDAPHVLDVVNRFIDGGKKRFTSLINYMANGGDTKFLLDRLAEEKDLFKSQVLSLIMIGKAIAQSIINTIQDILLTAVGKVLPANI